MHINNFNIEVLTYLNSEDNIIYQDEVMVYEGKDRKTILSRKVINLADEAIINMLRQLGWKSPEDIKSSLSCEGCVDFINGRCTDYRNHYCIRGAFMEDRYYKRK